MAGRLSRTLGVLALAVVGTTAAQAQMLGPGWYFELAVGKASFRDVTTTDLDGVARDVFDSFELPVQTLSSTLSDTDRSYALTSGYRISPYLSFEASFFRLGAFQYGASGTVSDAGAILPASFRFTYRAKGVLLGAAATLPLGNYLDLRGRAGITNSETRVRIAATVDGQTVNDQFSESSQDFFYGVGVGIKVLEYYRLGVDWMRHDSFGKAGGNGSTDIDNVLMSFSYEY